MRAQSSLEFLLVGSAVAAMCLFVVTFYAHNLLTQANAISSLANGTPISSYYGSLSSLLDAAATPQTDPQTNYTLQQSYSADISGRYEYLEYSLSSPSYLANLTQFSHCIQVGFFGHPYNISDQCGTDDAWYYFSGYDCMAMAGTFCIVPSNSSYYVLQTTGSRSYAYNFTLTLSTPYGLMRSQLSSNARGSALFLAGSPVGNAEVVGVSSTETATSAYVLGSSSGQHLVNQTAYADYSQAKNLLYPLLAFYNGTGAGSSTQASIEQAVAYFNSTERGVVGSSVQPTSCEVQGDEYVCAASSPFLYAINVTLGSGFSGVNETLYYLGSEISIRG